MPGSACGRDAGCARNVVFDAAMQAFASLSRAQRRDAELVGEAMRRAMRESLNEAWNKKPICHVHVLEL